MLELKPKYRLSLAEENPILAKEWHPIKNGNLTPYDFKPGSLKKVWWKCPKESDHEWIAGINKRTVRGQGCPFCSGHKVARSTSIATLNPKLAKEWHPTKNGKITPYDVGPGSGKKVWWKCTKGDDHEWEATVNNRNKGSGCSICSNRTAVISNSLAVMNPALAEEWHPTKNGDLTPSEVTSGSHKKVWWICKKGHEWDAAIISRSGGRGCPKCSSNTSAPEIRILCELEAIFLTVQHQVIINGYEVDIYIPDLKIGIEYDGEFWHRNKVLKDKEKNISLRSDLLLIRIREKGLPLISEEDISLKTRNISVSTVKKILRLILKNMEIDSERVLGAINEYMLRTDWIAENRFAKLYAEMCGVRYEESLSYLYPEVAKQWHPTKNGGLMPDNFLPGSNKKIWWKCPKGDDHEWKTQISDRCLSDTNCPICSGKKIVNSTCLATLKPELTKQWHPTKNEYLSPYDVGLGSNKKIWWKCAVAEDHEWQVTVTHRAIKGTGCPFCSNKKVTNSNCLYTVNPELAKQWHPTKNGKLTPYDVTPGSNKVVWWKCSIGDDHEWKTSVSARNIGSGCPFCINQKTDRFKSLAVLSPELAKEWHPNKNGKLTPYDVVPGSGKKVWWKCTKGDDHEWKTSIRNRKKGDGCPFCANRNGAKSNCLATINPELAKEWHPTKNGELTQHNVVPGSNKKVWWKCNYGHEWQAMIYDRSRGIGCPKCRENKRKLSFSKHKKSPGQLELI